jgi:hypothetical protein
MAATLYPPCASLLNPPCASPLRLYRWDEASLLELRWPPLVAAAREDRAWLLSHYDEATVLLLYTFIPPSSPPPPTHTHTYTNTLQVHKM